MHDADETREELAALRSDAERARRASARRIDVGYPLWGGLAAVGCLVAVSSVALWIAVGSPLPVTPAKAALGVCILACLCLIGVATPTLRAAGHRRWAIASRVAVFLLAAVIVVFALEVMSDGDGNRSGDMDLLPAEPAVQTPAALLLAAGIALIALGLWRMGRVRTAHETSAEQR